MRLRLPLTLLALGLMVVGCGDDDENDVRPPRSGCVARRETQRDGRCHSESVTKAGHRADASGRPPG